MLGKSQKKKLYISIMSCIVLLTFSVGIGSYAWFTDSVVSNGKIQVGTFKLNLEGYNESIDNPVLFNIGNMEPGVISNEKTISFINAGTLDMILRPILALDAKDPTLNNGVGDTNAYKIIARVYKNNDSDINNLAYSTADIETGESLSSFNSNLNSKLDTKDGVPIVFSSNDKLIFKVQLILDSALAKNVHQGDTVTGELKIEARQNIDGAVYSE